MFILSSIGSSAKTVAYGVVAGTMGAIAVTNGIASAGFFVASLPEWPAALAQSRFLDAIGQAAKEEATRKLTHLLSIGTTNLVICLTSYKIMKIAARNFYHRVNYRF